MKKFRKISALILALALICALAATAFASSFALDFPVAGRTVSIAGNMSQWSVIGEIYVDDGLDTGELRRASVEFWYIKNNWPEFPKCRYPVLREKNDWIYANERILRLYLAYRRRKLAKEV